MKIVQVSLKDLYQFLISDCRYGYSRNNHLMPGGAYDHVKTYLPFMKSVDVDMAINTAKQLCEECIEMELVQFADGIDDENGNRKAALEFIENMKAFVNAQFEEADWKPYNWDQYEHNFYLDTEPRYDIYDAEYMGYEMDNEFKLGKKLTESLLSKDDVMIYLCSYICKSDSITYRKQEYKPEYTHFETREDYNKEIMTKYVFDDIKKAVIVKRGDC